MKSVTAKNFAIVALLAIAAPQALLAAEGTNGVPSATNSVHSVDRESVNPLASDSASGHGHFGAGLLVGEPTGLSLKYWLSEKNAVDLGAAWSFEDHSAFQLHSDFLTHKFDLFPINSGELPLYFGVGGRVKIPDHGSTRAGVRVPVGISYLFADIPVEVFAEVAPIVDVTPATQLRFNGGIGVRYYFK